MRSFWKWPYPIESSHVYNGVRIELEAKYHRCKNNGDDSHYQRHGDADFDKITKSVTAGF